MPDAKGYRSERLRRRRRSRVERSQAWVLYVLAGVVAFAAVLGAWYVAGGLGGQKAEEESAGYLAAIQLTVPGEDAPVAALLVVQDAEGGDPGVYLVPPDLLLEGPEGQYVFAGDAMASGDFAEDLARVVNVPLDAVYTIPVADLGEWAASTDLRVDLEEPVTAEVAGDLLKVKDGGSVAVTELPTIFADESDNRRQVTELQTALVESALEAAALRPAAERSRLVSASPSPESGPSLGEIVSDITSGAAVVEQFPAGSRTAEGQFAFVPDAEEIQAAITRRSPAFDADVTVQVLNGSGCVGVAEAVIERLASLDVNLPSPLNADSFSYEQTQILAGPETLPVARNIRAILGRGVVLDGANLPDGTVEVIVGDDFKAPTSSTKDQQ